MKNLDVLTGLLTANNFVVGRANALGHGITDDELARWCRDGLIERVCLGTYRLVGAPNTPLHRAMVAVTAVQQRTVRPELVGIARESAAHLHGLTRRVPSTVAVVVPAGRTPSPDLRWVRVHRSRTLDVDDLTFVDGVPTCRASRAIADSTINLAVDRIMDLIAKGLHLELLTLDELSQALRKAGRIRGAPRFRTALCRMDPDAGAAASRGESAAFDALVAAGFEVVRQHPVGEGPGRFRLDLAILALMVAIEVDGYWWHFTPSAKAADEARQNAIVAAGYRPLRFGADQVLRRPEIVVEAVRRLAAEPLRISA